MLWSLLLSMQLSLAEEPPLETPAAPAEEPPLETPAAPAEVLPPEELPAAEVPARRLPLFGSPVAFGVAAGCVGCGLGYATFPFGVPAGLAIMAAAPAPYMLYSPTGERYPDPSQMDQAQRKARQDALRWSARGVLLGAGFGGAMVATVVVGRAIRTELNNP